MARTHRLAIVLSLLSSLAVAGSAYAAHVAGEEYRGRTSTGGYVTLKISPDGGFVERFSASFPVCGQSLDTFGYGGDPIVNHAFSQDSESLDYSGSFPSADTAQGAISYSDPFRPECSTQMTWSAKVWHTLALDVRGVGGATGIVKSSPGGIDCNTDDDPCQADFEAGQSVTLTAESPSQYFRATFMGWTGCDTVAGRTCTVKMTGDKSVTATYASAVLGVAVRKRGTSVGSVKGSPGSLVCPTGRGPLYKCDWNFGIGDAVVLIASPLGNSTFYGWTGCDSARGRRCSVKMNRSRSVGAAFAGPGAAPKTRITERRTEGRSVTFAFSSSEKGSTFECKLDGKRFSRCRSPKRYAVGPGPHTFQVRATDRHENTGRPARQRWTAG